MTEFLDRKHRLVNKVTHWLTLGFERTNSRNHHLSNQHDYDDYGHYQGVIRLASIFPVILITHPSSCWMHHNVCREALSC